MKERPMDPYFREQLGYLLEDPTYFRDPQTYREWKTRQVWWALETGAAHVMSCQCTCHNVGARSCSNCVPCYTPPKAVK